MDNKAESVEIRCLREDELGAAYDIRKHYLDDEPFDRCVSVWRAFADLCVGCFRSGRLIGIAYGYPHWTNPTEVILSGIAITEDFVGQGHGSHLLRFFGQQVVGSEYEAVSVGSAGGYVDHFYMKNGYEPIEFVFWVESDFALSPAMQTNYSIQDEPLEDGTRRLSVRISSLDEELRERLLADFPVKQVTAIMYKKVDSD